MVTLHGIARILVADDDMSKPPNQNELFSKLCDWAKGEESSEQAQQTSESGASGQETKQSVDAQNIRERLQELAEALDYEEMLEILDRSSVELKHCWQVLVAAKNAGDLAQLSREAHGMKGSYRNLGADMLAQMFELLERGAKDMDVDTLEQLLADTERAMQEVQAVLGKEKEKLSRTV